MNIHLVLRQLGLVCLLVAGFMVLSLPWAHPLLGLRNEASIETTGQFEVGAFYALLDSVAISLSLGLFCLWFGRHARGRLYRKEAMAIVGLSWMMATVLGALPYTFAKCARGPCLRYDEGGDRFCLLIGAGESWWPSWKLKSSQEVPTS